MKKISKEDIKNFWNEHKKAIIAGTVAAGGLVATGLVIWKGREKDIEKIPAISEGFGGGLTFWKIKPSRSIPETELFKILDIADDVNDGCVVWLDGCKLADCGKFGEGMSKIERVDPNMLVTMAILAKDKLEL